MTSFRSCLVTVVLLVMTMVNLSNTLPSTNTTGGYQQGFLYLTPQKRLKMPPSSLLVLTPTLSLPMGRDLPIGYGSSVTISYPFRIAFDDLGMTSEDNTWGLLRTKREAPKRGDLAGGDREVLYKVVEDTLQSVGMDGKACLLRAICEMYDIELQNYGFFGEVFELFLSPSRSPQAARRLQEYTEAEQRGQTEGRCLQYHQACPYSFFTDAPPASQQEQSAVTST
ncbi:uncharacterized protein LOC121861909 [Homarus americanus]|uniref:Putative DM4/DM12 family-like protein 12 n=1 Tax=Homarus americanus TaxID=6706 RepID=A0A8J5NJS8_HOMAM|nr:uncharacterized protein LOC121861750 [Homarus americanus]XP_042215673.1 uncharacterized protein LOC121861750 [Homarus americanus]XP_042215781.1 uncharacterized protein LOC121861909 [Homarus americanus]XP_042215852.1 uncharacterized protein LOC121861909 [Homarus americanus]KAG7178225.1 putative DM4/DM12 family-like protein 12 [Homarus americanus]KAG7178226.1 putative DM4/DM12 family-like protein 13 [Homarus americanus]